MKKAIETNNAPGAIGPYSQGVTVGDFVYVSGQIPMNPSTGELRESDIELQTAQSLDNIKAILEAINLTMDHIIKVNVSLKDMNQFAFMNDVYATYFTEPYPARAAVEVARLPKDALIEIEVIAYKKNND